MGDLPSADLVVTPAVPHQGQPAPEPGVPPAVLVRPGRTPGSATPTSSASTARASSATATSRSLHPGRRPVPARRDKWRWGFGAERTTDPTLFARYSVERRVRPARAVHRPTPQRLISQAYRRAPGPRTPTSRSRRSPSRACGCCRSGRPVWSPTTPPRRLPDRRAPDRGALQPELARCWAGGCACQGSAVALHRERRPEQADAGRRMLREPGHRQPPRHRPASTGAPARPSPTACGSSRSSTARGDAYSINNPLPADPNASFAAASAPVGADSALAVHPPGAAAPASSSSPWPRSPSRPTASRAATLPNEDIVALRARRDQPVLAQPLPRLRPLSRAASASTSAAAPPGTGAPTARPASSSAAPSATKPDPAFYDGSGLEGTSSDWVTSVDPGADPGPAAVLAHPPGDRRPARCGVRKQGPTSTSGAYRPTARYLYNERDVTGRRHQSLNLSATSNLTQELGRQRRQFTGPGDRRVAVLASCRCSIRTSACGST